MEKSFRAILNEILDGKETEPTPSAAFSPAPEMSFSWFGPRLAQSSPRPTYARPAYTPPPEKVIAIADLSPALRFHADMLLALGATEIADGLNARRLRQAHRRLAKRLHPDIAGDQARAQFLSLQEAYERLRKAIS